MNATCSYELWDGETRNVLGTYASEEAALAVIRNLLQKHGPGAIAGLLLGREDESGRSTLIAEGSALVRRAEAAAATPIGGDPRVN